MCRNICITSIPGVVARLDLEGAQAIQTEELVVEEEVDYVLSVGEEKIALQPKALQDQQVKDLITVRIGMFIVLCMCPGFYVLSVLEHVCCVTGVWCVV